MKLKIISTESTDYKATVQETLTLCFNKNFSKHIGELGIYYFHIAEDEEDVNGLYLIPTGLQENSIPVKIKGKYMYKVMYIKKIINKTPLNKGDKLNIEICDYVNKKVYKLTKIITT